MVWYITYPAVSKYYYYHYHLAYLVDLEFELELRLQQVHGIRRAHTPMVRVRVRVGVRRPASARS